MFLFVLQLSAYVMLCFGQNDEVKTDSEPIFLESKANFSIELLHHAAKQQGNQNLVVSPFAAWTILAVTSEGASGKTRRELLTALRSSRTIVRHYFQEIARWLTINTTTAQYTKFNGIFVDKSQWTGMLKSFRQISEEIYYTDAVDLTFENIATAAATINRAVSLTTNGWITNLINENHLTDVQLVGISAVYFTGQWTAPFKVSSTTNRHFYNSIGEKIGEVNMMFNRFKYPLAVITELQATVIELPYGVENHLSMIIMMPNSGITLQDMFSNFHKTLLKTVFQDLRVSQGRNIEIDCFIPRFKTDSNVELSKILKNDMGIHDLFDPKKVFLGELSRWPISGVNIIHKTVIEVTEDGPAPAGNTAGEYINHTTAIFEANRPFSYFIVEKHTNCIILAGVYQRPILY